MHENSVIKFINWVFHDIGVNDNAWRYNNDNADTINDRDTTTITTYHSMIIMIALIEILSNDNDNDSDNDNDTTTADDDYNTIVIIFIIICLLLIRLDKLLNIQCYCR